MITKNYEAYQEYLRKDNFVRAISKFYDAYFLSLLVIGESDAEYSFARNRLFSKILLSYDRLHVKHTQEFRGYLDKDLPVIIRAIKLLNAMKDDPNQVFHQIDRPFCIGVLTAEIPR